MVVLPSRWCSLSKNLSAMFIGFQVQRQVEAGKASKVDTDLKDETVRGTIPLFKLRSKNDREQWRKLAFPLPDNMQPGAECRKYTVDSSIMATIILDLQPFNQVNRWVIIFETPQYSNAFIGLGFK